VPQSLAGQIRERFPRTVTFGMAGTTVLPELAILREFVEPTRPRVVIWTVNPNFVTAEQEINDPVLRRYLDPAFSQGLIGRQAETDRFIRDVAVGVEAELNANAARLAREQRIDRMLGSWRLPELTSRLLVAMRASATPRRTTNLDTYRQVLATARDAVEKWGGELIVVVLPIYAEVVAGQVEPGRRHRNLARVAEELGIPVVNGVELFNAVPDPAALFTMRINNHPTAEGYALLAGKVADEIGARVAGIQDLADTRSGVAP
jgi:hypothetical protein